MAAKVEPREVEVASAQRVAFDGWMLVTTLALVGMGLVMVYSSSIPDAYVVGSSTYYLKREVLWIIFGAVALVVGSRVTYTVWQRLSTLFALAGVLLLLGVLIPHVGFSSHGAQRWFQLAGFRIEPSEVVKPGLAIYFAHWLSEKGDKIRRFGACSAPFGIMLGVVCVLVLKQPDMGTAMVIALAMLAVYFVAGARLDHLGLGIGAGFAAGVAAIRLESYRGTRFAAWLDPWKYAHGAGYHTVQALLALGLGGLTGVGLGNSQQKYYLPAPYTDSIFAVTAEELGFLGALLIVGLFVLFAYRGFKIGMRAEDDFGKLLAVGITATIVIQAFINIAVITASLPFTGVPLPFISYGGSSLVMSMFGVGILLNISWKRRNGKHTSHDDSQAGGPKDDAHSHHRRQNGRTRLSGVGRRRILAPALVRTKISEQERRASRHYG